MLWILYYLFFSTNNLMFFFKYKYGRFFVVWNGDLLYSAVICYTTLEHKTALAIPLRSNRRPPGENNSPSDRRPSKAPLAPFTPEQRSTSRSTNKPHAAMGRASHQRALRRTAMRAHLSHSPSTHQSKHHHYISMCRRVVRARVCTVPIWI